MPINPLFPCCDFPADVDPPSISDSGREGKCHPTGTSCPKGSICLTHTEPSSLEPITVCQCVKLDEYGFVPDEYLMEEYPWTIKGRELLASISDTLPYQVSRTVITKTTPIPPVFLREFLGRLPVPPSVELSVPTRTPPSKRGTDYNLGKPTLSVSTGLNDYYGNTNGMTLYLRWRLGLGNAYQSWWPYDASDFPEDWWLPNVTDSWNDLFDECGEAPPRGQGLCCEAQAICAAQKHHWLWAAVQRAAERNTQQALKFS